MSQVRSASIFVYHQSAELLHLAVLVGNQTFNLAVDTGSSITWVGAGTKYVPSSSSTRTNFSVNVHYGSASSFKGQEYNDTVRLPIMCCAFCRPNHADIGCTWLLDCNQTIHWCRKLPQRFQRGRRVRMNLPGGLYSALLPRY